MPDYVTAKIYTDTRRLLRLLAAETGEQMVQVMDRLCREEMQKLGMNVAPERYTGTKADTSTALQSPKMPET